MLTVGKKRIWSAPGMHPSGWTSTHSSPTGFPKLTWLPRQVELPNPARAQGTQTSTFTNSITNTPRWPSAQRCLIQERSTLDHELFSLEAFQAILPSQSPPPVVFLFAAQHHKHFYQPASLKSNCFLHDVKPSLHNALSFPWSHFPSRVSGVGSVGRHTPTLIPLNTRGGSALSLLLHAQGSASCLAGSSENQQN